MNCVGTFEYQTSAIQIPTVYEILPDENFGALVSALRFRPTKEPNDCYLFIIGGTAKVEKTIKS